MTINRKNFEKLVSKEKTDTVSRAKERLKNRAWLIEAQEIALDVLEKLDELGWSQAELAERLDVTPQQVSGIVSGKENLTLEIIVKLKHVLNIPVLSGSHERQADALN